MFRFNPYLDTVEIRSGKVTVRTNLTPYRVEAEPERDVTPLAWRMPQP